MRAMGVVRATVKGGVHVQSWVEGLCWALRAQVGSGGQVLSCLGGEDDNEGHVDDVTSRDLNSVGV